jgi:uncharacterized protein involved in exopolysaccharide biosynthesis
VANLNIERSRVSHERDAQPISSAASQDDGLELSFDEVFRLLRRHWSLVVASIGISVAVALVYLIVTPAQYTATALLLIDTKTAVLPSQQLRATDANSESANVETQAEVLRSERIARAVIASQRLLDQPDFAPRDRGLARRALDKVHELVTSKGGAANDDATDPLAGAIKEFRSRLDVKRNQSTYIIEISFRSSDPKVAANIANAVTNEYKADQLKQREENIRGTSAWLKQRALDQFRSLPSSGNAAGRGVLRDLESTAQTYRNISESFQKRFLETAQGQTYSLLDARVVSEAWAPIEKSHPRSSLILAVAAAIGLGVGFLTALAKGMGERV